MEYNGWTNYATWRINLEIIGDMEFDEQVSADYLKDLVEDCVFSNNYLEFNDGAALIEDYAKAFINEVNYHEIAQHINEEIDLQTKYEN